MDLSQRDFFNLSAAALTGTAAGGLAGLGVSLAPALAQAQELRIKQAKATPSVCPYCSVGCATLVHTVAGKIVNIEGDSRSPHSEGTGFAAHAAGATGGRKRCAVPSAKSATTLISAPWSGRIRTRDGRRLRAMPALRQGAHRPLADPP